MGLCHLLAKLRQANLRPTRQRLALAQIILTGPKRHLDAHTALRDAHGLGLKLSLATVYNTLDAFCRVGLMRRIAIASRQAIYDRGMSDHHHFLVDDDGSIMDIPEGTLRLDTLPDPPAGYAVVGADIIVRLRRIDLGAEENQMELSAGMGQ